MPQILKGDSKVAKLKNQLIAEVRRGKYPVGKRLPSTRKIASEYGISTVTASLALAELRAMGLVESRKGSGTYISESANSADKEATLSNQTKRIGLVVNDSLRLYSSHGLRAHPTIEQQVEGIRGFFTSRDCLVKMIPFQRDRIGEEGTLIWQVVQAKEVDGLLITGRIGQNELNWLLQQPIPFVFIDCNIQYHESISGNLLAGVYLDICSGVRLLFSHLANQGYSDCMFLTYTRDDSAENIRNIRIRTDSGATGDFGVSKMMKIPNEGGIPSREVYRDYVKKILRLSPRLVVTRDEVMANHLLWHARSLDLRIPEDLAVASIIDMTPDNHPMSLTAVATRDAIKQVAYEATSILDQAMQGTNRNHGTKVLVMPTLTFGESSGSVQST